MSLPPELAYLHRCERCPFGLCGRHTAINNWGTILERSPNGHQPRHARTHSAVATALLHGTVDWLSNPATVSPP